jgi:hypothetical protein
MVAPLRLSPCCDAPSSTSVNTALVATSQDKVSHGMGTYLDAIGKDRQEGDEENVLLSDGRCWRGVSV